MMVNQLKRGNECLRVALVKEETLVGHHMLMLISLKTTIMHRTKEMMDFSETLHRL